MTELSVPLLNRLFEAMFPHADPKADQNIWNLARAAEEVISQESVHEFFRTGDPAVLKYPTVAEACTPPNHWAPRPGEGSTPTGRMQMAPIPLGYASGQEPSPNPDYAAQLGEVERRLMLKAPQYTGATTADKVDELAQDYQAVSFLLEEVKRENNRFTEKLSAAEEVISQTREALDPDGQFEDEGLLVLARECMGRLRTAKKEYQKLQERIGTEIEHNSAEMLRQVLGARENETLGAAAKRVAESAKTSWEQYRRLNDLQNNQFHQLNTAIRDIVDAVDEFESDDHYTSEQPTTDAVRRVVARLIEVDRHLDGSRKSAHEILNAVQDTWDGRSELPAFPWERRHSGPKAAFEGPRYVVRKSSDNPDFDNWAVWDKQTGDWFVSVDVGTKSEAERRAAGLNETEDA